MSQEMPQQTSPEPSRPSLPSATATPFTPSGKTIVIIQGPPDPAGGHLCHALAEAYAEGAREAGHDVRRVEVGRLDFPLVRTEAEFNSSPLPPALEDARSAVAAAAHVVVVFPLWLGTMPALLKAFFEQLMRPGFAFVYHDAGGLPEGRLKGRSARVVVTMGMPALLFRLFYFSHGLAVLERNILGLSGFGPVRSTVLGMVEDAGARRRDGWLARMRRLGRDAR